jgi:hypothetical protein
MARARSVPVRTCVPPEGNPNRAFSVRRARGHCLRCACARDPAPSSFAGPYGFVYGGASRSTFFNTSTGVIINEDVGSKFARIPFASLGAGIGYNVAVGPLVGGIEGRGHYDFAQATAIQHYTGYNCGLVSPYCVPYGYGYINTFQQRWGADVAWRFGFTPTPDLLVYGKVGAGVRETRTSSQYCDTNYIRGCQPYTGFNPTVFVPTILVGTGFEKNFGSWFVRVEAELAHGLDNNRSINSSIASGTLGVGFRF